MRAGAGVKFSIAAPSVTVMRDAGYIGAVTRGIQIAIVDFASCIQKPVLVDGGLERLQLKAAIPFESIAAQTDTQHASYN